MRLYTTYTKLIYKLWEVVFTLVSLPKKYLPKVKDFMDWMTAKKVSENRGSVTFEVPFSFVLNMKNLEIGSYKEWKDFCKEIRVEGGRKSMFRDRLSFTPRLSRYVTFKVADAELQMLREFLKREGSPPVSVYLRRKIEEDMLQYRRRARKTEEVIGYE